MVRVLVVDDDPLVRTLLSRILGQQGFDVVGEAGDGDEVVPAVQAHRPDVVVMDLRMPRMDGVLATAALQRLAEPPAVLAITSFDTGEAVVEVVQAGAAGLIAKDAGPEEIAHAVRLVAAGDGALSARAARALVAYVAADESDRTRSQARERLADLTDRERDIAAAVAEDLSNAEIASRTYIAEATVKTHLTRVLAKLGLSSRTQLAVLADRAGLGADRTSR